MGRRLHKRQGSGSVRAAIRLAGRCTPATWLWALQSQVVILAARRITVRLTGAAIAAGGLGLMGLGTAAAPSLSGGVALQSSVGDDNAGDFFLDSISLGPGGETDPHLGCPASIIVGGMNLADPSGGFTIFGWPPSGSQESLLSGTWQYNTIVGGTQTIATVSATTLVNDAIAAGDTVVNPNGLHFKIQVGQDPTKFKTFWLDCTPTTSTTTTTTSSTPATTTTTTTAPEETTTTTAPEETTTTTAPAESTTTPAAPPEVVSSSSTASALGVGAGSGSGVLGASTGTPSTGADVQFGLGLGLAIGGGTLAFAAGPLGRRFKK